jgi:hypothetical protein
MQLKNLNRKLTSQSFEDNNYKNYQLDHKFPPSSLAYNVPKDPLALEEC